MLPLPKDSKVVEALFDKYLSGEELWQKDYELCTSDLKRMSKYTGLNFNEVLDLPYSLYLLYRKESWIESWLETEKGRDLLKTLWRINKTEPDMVKVREYSLTEGGKNV